jgi:orotidine-5'-phosphate decarboxylase
MRALAKPAAGPATAGPAMATAPVAPPAPAGPAVVLEHLSKRFGDLEAVRSAAPGLLTVVPGIRPEGVPAQEQVRTGTPAEAIGNGADILVVGRAVTAADDPLAAAAGILEEVSAALETLS